MVYAQQLLETGGEMLSTTEAMEILGVTKATLMKWIECARPKIKSRKYQIGGRYFYGFSAAEVKRVKAKMNKKYVPGIGWFREG